MSVHNLHDITDELDIEAARQPALHKPAVHKRSCGAEVATPN